MAKHSTATRRFWSSSRTTILAGLSKRQNDYICIVSKEALRARIKRMLKKHGLKGVNKPKRTPGHPKKSHIVLAKEGNKVKLIRYGQQGAKTAGKPKAGESDRMKKKRASFKARHRKNIARGKMSAAFWANKSKW